MMDRVGSALAGGGVSEWRTYERLLQYAKPHWRRLAGGFLAGAVFAGSSVGILPALRENFAHLIDYQNTPLQRVLLLASLLPLLALVRGVGEFVSEYLIRWVGNRVVLDLRVALFDHMQSLSSAYFDQERTGDIMSRTVNDTLQVEKAVSQVLADLARQPLLLGGALGYLFYLDWKLALGAAVLSPVFIVPVTLLGRKVRRFSRQGQERMADVTSILQEVVSGIRIVKAFGREDHERGRFSEECRRLFERMMRIVEAQAVVQPIVTLVASIGLVAVLAYAGAADMPFENFVTFAMALVVLYDPAKKLSRLHLAVQQSSGAADRIFELLDTPPSVRDRADAVPLEGEIASIAFEDVRFAYADKPVLDGISFEVSAGQRIALVGGSGAGKTTLVNLLPRFFDVTGGCVRINGRDVRDCTLQSLRAQIGLVTQETFLFNDTVANNIAYGRPDATRAEIEEAAVRAHALAFVREMPGGFDTMIGERGVRLSGGQRQRLSIARAILRNPPLLLLDEATSALDTEAERQVQAALEELMRGRTVFAIAHRLSTIVTCDRILVLGGGRVIESGTHAELLAQGGAYRRLYDMQFQ